MKKTLFSIFILIAFFTFFVSIQPKALVQDYYDARWVMEDETIRTKDPVFKVQKNTPQSFFFDMDLIGTSTTALFSIRVDSLSNQNAFLEYAPSSTEFDEIKDLLYTKNTNGEYVKILPDEAYTPGTTYYKQQFKIEVTRNQEETVEVNPNNRYNVDYIQYDKNGQTDVVKVTLTGFEVGLFQIKLETIYQSTYTTINHTFTMIVLDDETYLQNLTFNGPSCSTNYLSTHSGTTTDFVSLLDTNNNIVLNKDELKIYTINFDRVGYSPSYLSSYGIDFIYDLVIKNDEIAKAYEYNDVYKLELLQSGKTNALIKVKIAYTKDSTKFIYDYMEAEVPLYVYGMDDITFKVNSIALTNDKALMLPLKSTNYLSVHFSSFLAPIYEYFKYEVEFGDETIFDNALKITDSTISSDSTISYEKRISNFGEAVSSESSIYVNLDYLVELPLSSDVTKLRIRLVDLLLNHATGGYNPNAGVFEFTTDISGLNEESYYLTPQLANEVSPMIVYESYITEDTQLPIKVTNYSYVKEYASLSTKTSSGEVFVEEDTIYLIPNAFGRYDLEISFTYQDIVKTKFISVIFKEANAKMTLNKNNITIEKNSFDKVYLGYYENNVFQNITTGNILNDLEIRINNDIIDVQNNFYLGNSEPATLTITGLEKGTSQVTIIEMSQGTILNINVLNVTVLETKTEVFRNYTFEEGEGTEVDFDNTFAQIELTIPLELFSYDNSTTWISRNPDVAIITQTIDNKATVEIRGSGTTTITCISKTNDEEILFATFELKVLSKDLTNVTRYDLNGKKEQLVKLSNKIQSVLLPLTIPHEFYNEDYTYTFELSNKKIGQINQNNDGTYDASIFNEGELIIKCIGKYLDEIKSIGQIKIVATYVPETIYYNFNGLEEMRISLTEEMLISVPSEYYKSYNITWFTNSTEAFNIQEVSKQQVLVKAISNGEGIINCVCKDERGNTYIGTTKIIVEMPTFEIVIKAKDAKSGNLLTKDDNILIDLATNGFNDFSVTYTLNDDQVDIREFQNDGKKLNVGTYQLKALINFISSQLSPLEVTKTIVVYEDGSKGCSLMFPTKSQNLLLEGNDCIVEVLNKGLSFNDNDYTWEFDPNYLQLKMQDGPKISIVPLKVGKTKLKVSKNIGTISEPNTISAELEINIEKFESLKLEEASLFHKPNSTVSINVLINGKIFANVDEIITTEILKSGENVNFKLNNSKIEIENVKKGNYNLTTTIAKLNQNAKLKVEVTNIPLKQLLKVSLPYLIIVCFIATIISVIIKHQKSDFERVKQQISKLNIELETTITSLDDKNSLKKLKSLYHKFKHISYKVSYLVDKGIDELRPVAYHIDISTKALKAGCKSDVKNSTLKIKKLLSAILTKDIKKANEIFSEVENSRKVFEETTPTVTKQEEPKKKIKMTPAEYLRYLESLNYIDEEE